jgi:hypothetical protein
MNAFVATVEVVDGAVAPADPAYASEQMRHSDS